jgi:Family of unknown function (DUF6308)
MQLTLPEALDGTDHDKAVTALRTYFGLGAGLTPYTGAFFERLGGGGDRGEIRDVITAEDLVAVSMLSVDVPARAALRILGTDGRRISDLLSEIPTALDLVDVDPEVINGSWPGWQLWDLLHGMYGVGPVTAGKLVARKRPRLLPVYDSVVAERVGSPKGFWAALNCDLRADDKALNQKLLDIRAQAEIGNDISALRVFDIVTWMPGAERDPSRGGA